MSCLYCNDNGTLYVVISSAFPINLIPNCCFQSKFLSGALLTEPEVVQKVDELWHLWILHVLYL